MADCRRVPLLLLLCSFLFVLQTLAENDPIPKFIPKGETKAQAAGALGGAAANPAAVERNPGAAASLPRRRSAGWKLAEEALCRDDLVRLCPKHTWNNNLAVLECLQDRKEVRTAQWVQLGRGQNRGVPSISCQLALS